MSRIRVEIEWDWKFFAILPAVNINVHSKGVELEWLFVGLYFSIAKKAPITPIEESFHT